MCDLFDRRLLVVIGKGGVGKSLVSAALARLALKRGKRTLLVQINTKDKIAGYLGCDRAGEDIREVMPGLFSVNIRPAAALKEYVLLKVRLELIYRLVFENRAVRYFLRAVPALNDLVVLGKIYYHVNQTDRKSGRPLYDLVIVDAPATGHGLFLLNLPNVMVRAVKSGPIHREAKGMLEMLQDPEQTAINLVTIPEEMPVAETVEMYQAIAEDYGMPLGFLFVNAIFPRLFEPDDEGRIERLIRYFSEDRAVSELIEIARATASRRKLCNWYLKELTSRVPLSAVRIPYIFSDTDGPEVTDEVAGLIERELMNYHGC